MNFAIIMAGGKGTRFWPVSREKMPKQFLSLNSPKPMIQETLDRIRPVVTPKNTLIITNKKQIPALKKTKIKIPNKNIIAEPVGRNTAPCLQLGSLIAAHSDSPDAVVIALPADHVIENKKKFQGLLRQAIKEAKKSDSIIVFGIKPTHPETGFGYIETKKGERGLVSVKRFVEKPNLTKAKKYYRSKSFYWNSGIFVFKASTLLNATKKHLPRLSKGLSDIEKSFGKKNFSSKLTRIYPKLPNISIDYGILEKHKSIKLIPANVGWDDLGNWLAISKKIPKDSRKNNRSNNALFVDSKNSLIFSKDKFVTLLGVDNLITIVTEDAVLVTSKDASQKVGQVTQHLKKNKKLHKYL